MKPNWTARVIFLSVLLSALAAPRLWSLPIITSMARSSDDVGRYAKLELTVGLKAAFTNAYNPDEISLWGEFTSPSHKTWKVNGFYDGAEWKIRFAANETGAWKYVVKATDATGTATGPRASFNCVASTNHGWVRVAPNRRYLQHDDGTSFYGVGVCYPWNVTANGFDQMRALGFNIYVYWNGTYDRDGGSNLIESAASGIGHYDETKCKRLDDLIDWSEARGLGMILVIWPHDYLSEHMRGWAGKWTNNAYSAITTSTNFYGDANAWAYQEKLYRYIIARWGYSESLASWQTIDEISGTSGWTNRAAANAWTGKIARYFHDHDPFKHPSNASEGDFWENGNEVNDLSNTEIYRNYSTSNIVTTIQKMWNGFEKPAIMGETGVDRSAEITQRKLWGGLASGIAVTPLLWSFSQRWSTNASSQFAPFEKFIADIDFAHLTAPAQAQVSVAGADAYGITSHQLTFGWVNGDLAGKSLDVSGLGNGKYQVEWWDCVTGMALSTNAVKVARGSLSVTLPNITQKSLAFKIIRNSKRGFWGIFE